MKKLKQTLGESVAETLVAVLIISLAFAMLSTAVVTSARINAALKNEDSAFTAGTAVSPPSWRVTVRMDAQEQRQAATLYETENGYHYYEYTP